MIEKDPNTWGWVATFVKWLALHAYLAWGILTSVAASMWASFADGKGLMYSLFGAVISVAITLSVMAVMIKVGWHKEYLPIVGMIVGFIGAERIRGAILSAWESRKNNTKVDK